MSTTDNKARKAHKVGTMFVSLVVAVVLLVGLAIGAFALQTKADQKAAEQEKQTEIINVEESEIESVTLESRKDTYTLVQDGYQDNVLLWKIQNQDNTNVEQYKLGLIINRCKKLTLMRDLGQIDQSNSEIMKLYGLDQPASIVTIKFKTGPRTLLLGSAYTNGFYLLEKGSSELYIVPANAGQYFTMTSNDLRALPGLLVEMGNIAVIRLEHEGSSTVQVANLPALIEEGYAWKMLSPVVGNTVASKMSAYIDKIKAFSMQTYIAPLVGDDLSVYGFDKPYARMSLVAYNEEYPSQIIVVGKPIEDNAGFRYCATYITGENGKTLEKSVVYAIDEASLDIFRMEAINLLDKQFALVNIIKVHTINITVNGKKETIEITRKPKLDDDGDPIVDKSTGEKVTLDTFTLKPEDRILNDISFRAFYTKLIGIHIASMLREDDPEEYGDEVFSFEILTSISLSEKGDATLKITGSCRELDTNYYLLTFNEDASQDTEITNRCKVRKDEIDTLITAYGMAKAGTLPGVRD